jgi:alpha-1,2-mannosyltransferase
MTRMAPALWVVAWCSLGASLAYAISGSWHGHQIDFDVYRMGGQSIFGDRLYLNHIPRYGLGFTYPDFAALMASPFALISLTSGQVVWSLVNEAALFALLLVTIRALRPVMARRTVLRWALVGLAPALWLQPIRFTFNVGQVNVVVVLLVLGDLTCDLHVGRVSLPKGFLIGIAGAIKLTPLLFVPFLFLTGRTRAGWTAISSFLACNVLVALLAPRATVEYWTKYVFEASRIGKPSYISDQNVRALLLRLHHGPVSPAVLIPVTLAFAGAGLALSTVAHRRSSSFLGILVCATTGLLVSPITWSHHLVWVLPAIAWLAVGDDRPRGGMLWATATAVLFWMAPIWKVPQGANRELSEHATQLLVGNAYVLAMLIFMIGIAIMLRIRTSQPDNVALEPASLMSK